MKQVIYLAITLQLLLTGCSATPESKLARAKDFKECKAVAEEIYREKWAGECLRRGSDDKKCNLPSKVALRMAELSLYFSKKCGEYHGEKK